MGAYKTNLFDKGGRSTVTQAKRAQLKGRFDQFTTFY